MRLLHISRFFHPHIGGTETFIASLIAATASCGVESRVLATSRRQRPGGPQPRVPVSRVAAIGPDFLPKPIGGWAAIYRAFAWADIVHLHDIRFLLETSVLARALSGKPLI